MTAMAAEVGVQAGSAAARKAREQASFVARNAKVAPGDRAYQPVILAEFLAAVVVITLVPVVTGGSETAKAKGGISPYDTGDLRQIVAVGGVYFVLALASSGNSGRLSAWLGGLVLIAVLMGKLAHGNLSAVFNATTPPAQGPGGKDTGPAPETVLL